MSHTHIRLQFRERVAHLTLARPEHGNALTVEMAEELAQAASRIADASGAGAVLLSGAGTSFCVGGDVKSFSRQGDRLCEYLRPTATALHLAVSRLVRLDLPVVAAVQGAAAGAGMSLACSADFVIAADTARFTMAYTRIGLSVDGGSSYFLPRIVGMRRAVELMLTNRVLSAEEARDWGIVTRIVPATDLAREAEALAAALASGATRALRAAKRLVREGWSESLETQLEQETREIVEAGRSADAREGIQAFVEKRAPHFRGE
ncbi:MAG TPA: enoyl-CoA hydratase-related protein [Candidatus Binatia bacterium]|nr:enoyl-CoA hydratase-related protein [Candidatus Binatia bacterium]